MTKQEFLTTVLSGKDSEFEELLIALTSLLLPESPNPGGFEEDEMFESLLSHLGGQKDPCELLTLAVSTGLVESDN
jgi:hypothetical protein